MALWLCEGTYDGDPCGTLYAVGLFRCPRCHSTRFHEFGSVPEDEEHPMAKISRHGGPSDATREAVEHPADGTLSPPIEGDGTGEALPPADVEAAGDSPEAGAVGEPYRPRADSNKPVWVTWANEAGYDARYVDTLTKAELQDLPDDPNDSDDYVAWVDELTAPDNSEDEEGEGAEDDPADGAEQS